MSMPASGDADSPMANRGWRPRSSSITRQPEPPRDHRQDRAAEARPDDGEVRRRASQAHTTAVGDALLAVHHRQPRRARRRARAGEEPLDVPEVGEHAHAGRVRQAGTRRPHSSADAAAAARTRRRALPSRRCRRASESPSTRSRRTPRRDRSSGTPTRRPRPAGRNGGLSRTNTRSAMSCRRRKSAARRKRVERHALVEPRQHVRMRRLEADRHLEPAGEQIAKAHGSAPVHAGEKRRVRLDDHALEAVDRRARSPRRRPAGSPADRRSCRRCTA